MVKGIICLVLVVASVTLAQTNAPAVKAPMGSKIITIQEMLVIGSSGMRLHSLAMITQHKLKGGVNESCLPGFKACSDDLAIPVRSVTAHLLGEHFVAGEETPNPEAVELLIKLAKDKSPDVRYSAVYHGITQIQNKSDEIVELLIDVASTNREQGLYERIVQSLEKNKEQVVQILDKRLAEGDNITIYEIYKDLTGKQPPYAEKYLDMPSSRPLLFIFKDKGDDPETFKAELEKELKANGVESPELSISGFGENHVLLLKTYLTKDRVMVEKAFSNSEKFRITQQMWLTPALETQIDAMKNNN